MRGRKMLKLALGDKEQQAWRAARAEAHYFEWADAVTTQAIVGKDGPRVYELDYFGWSR